MEPVQFQAENGQVLCACAVRDHDNLLYMIGYDTINKKTEKSCRSALSSVLSWTSPPGETKSFQLVFWIGILAPDELSITQTLESLPELITFPCGLLSVCSAYVGGDGLTTMTKYRIVWELNNSPVKGESVEDVCIANMTVVSTGSILQDGVVELYAWLEYQPNILHILVDRKAQCVSVRKRIPIYEYVRVSSIIVDSDYRLMVTDIHGSLYELKRGKTLERRTTPGWAEEADFCRETQTTYYVGDPSQDREPKRTVKGHVYVAPTSNSQEIRCTELSVPKKWRKSFIIGASDAKHILLVTDGLSGQHMILHCYSLTDNKRKWTTKLQSAFKYMDVGTRFIFWIKSRRNQRDILCGMTLPISIRFAPSRTPRL